MRLWTVNLFIPGVTAPIRLVFKSEERAKQALHQPLGMDGSFSINDEFGVEAKLSAAPAARVLCDVVEEFEANIEFSLLQHRASMKAQKRAASDPTLGNSGSSIISPGNGPILPFPQR